MTDYTTRSLRKALDTLSPVEQRFLDQFTCSVAGCGKEFVFEISKEAQEQADKKKRRYSGRCGYCGTHIKLTNSQYERWRSVIDGSELRVLDTKFDQFFKIT